MVGFIERLARALGIVIGMGLMYAMVLGLVLLLAGITIAAAIKGWEESPWLVLLIGAIIWVGFLIGVLYEMWELVKKRRRMRVDTLREREREIIGLRESCQRLRGEIGEARLVIEDLKRRSGEG